MIKQVGFTENEVEYLKVLFNKRIKSYKEEIESSPENKRSMQPYLTRYTHVLSKISAYDFYLVRREKIAVLSCLSEQEDIKGLSERDYLLIYEYVKVNWKSFLVENKIDRWRHNQIFLFNII